METKKRPTLSDPEEFALIKRIYFGSDLVDKEYIDPIENLERIDAKQRNINNNSR